VFCTKSFDYEVITMARLQPTIQICVPVWLLKALQDAAAQEMSTISAVGKRALARGLGLDQVRDEADTSQASR
jgi:hypothetical protein